MRSFLGVFGALVLVLTGASCAADDGSSTPPAQEADAEATSNSIEVTMQDYAFAVEGEAQAGPLTLNFSNIGEELHHAIIGKLDQGKTLEDVQKVLAEGEGPPPPWFEDAPIDMTIVSPGASAGLVMDVEEGTYVLLCFMPDAKGKPHFTHGMAQTLEVSAGGGAEQVETDAELSMTESGVDAPELSSGTSIVSVTNDGKEPGEVFVVQLAEGKSLDDLDPWFRGGQKGDAPATFFGGTHQFAPGETVTLRLELEPGDYQIVSSYGEGPNIKDTPTDFSVTE